jgi:dynamin 1-like protein
MAQTHRGSPPSARETFLNYFFGQNGPGPIAGSSVGGSQGHHSRPSGSGHSVVPVGRDVSGGESSNMTIASGLMSGQRNMDGSNAAYDMKSLGKHIEAVRNVVLCFIFL